MSQARGPVVVDTVVFGAGLTARSDHLAQLYASILVGRQLLITVQTISELYFGALKDGWGSSRLDRMESRLALAAVVPSDERLARACARLRVDCLRAGHPLADKIRTNDLWIAAAAVRYDVPLVTHDTVFQATPGLQVLTGLQSGS